MILPDFLAHIIELQLKFSVLSKVPMFKLESLFKTAAQSGTEHLMYGRATMSLVISFGRKIIFIKNSLPFSSSLFFCVDCVACNYRLLSLLSPLELLKS